MSGPIPLSELQLGLAALLLLFDGLLSIALGLKLERRILIATIRATVQLFILGWVLVPIFSLKHPALVLLICAVLLFNAGRESVRRVGYSYQGMTLHAVGSMALSGGGTAVVATTVLIGVDPWYDPQYLIPLVGMILGNALTGVSLGLDRALSLLFDRKNRVEALLSFGATPWEASREIASESIRTGMIPIINAMSAVGLVSIPGMMTGQILGGTPPVQAARYQLLILFLIAGAVGLGTTLAVLGAIHHAFDEAQRLRLDRFSKKG